MGENRRNTRKDKSYNWALCTFRRTFIQVFEICGNACFAVLGADSYFAETILRCSILL